MVSHFGEVKVVDPVKDFEPIPRNAQAPSRCLARPASRSERASIRPLHIRRRPSPPDMTATARGDAFAGFTCLLALFTLGPAAACSSGETTPPTKISCIRNLDGDGCSCEAYNRGPAPTEQIEECSSDAFPGTTCCAAPGWPGPSSETLECDCVARPGGDCPSSTPVSSVPQIRVDSCRPTRPSSGAGHCSDKEPGTNYAPCDADSDCYGGFCDETGNPGPYCYPPTPTALDSGRGYTCNTDQECNDVLDADVLASGPSVPTCVRHRLPRSLV